MSIYSSLKIMLYAHDRDSYGARCDTCVVHVVVGVAIRGVV